MANYQNLMAAISAVIKTNNRREITGQILQNVLNEMVGSLGENMQLTGFANPLTNPGTPDQNVFYFATQAGIYHHFDDIELDDGFSVLMWKNGQWTANTLEIAVTRQWVQNNFVSIEFFRKMFRAYTSGGAEVVPNDVQGVIDNIKAMCGMWTEQYLSALGLDHGGGGGLGARYLTDLLDVTITSVQNGQALIYNSTLQQWVNGTAGVDMATVWSNLAGATSEQVNISHLTGALSGYATTESLTQQINSTKTWVTSNFITIAYFDRLFRAYNGSTLVSHNDTTSTIDNIKAMFGFWTDFYLSALGTGGVSSVSISLSQLADVNVAGVTNGQVLSYNSTSGTWVPATISGGGTDMNTVWTNLAAATNEQINISHLTTALSGYATTSALGSYLPLTGGALSGMLTMNATLYMNTNNLYYEKTFQTGASRHAEFGSPSGVIYDSIGDPAIGFENNGTAVGEERFTFGIGWYGNFVGRTAFFNGFYKNGSSDQYVLLGGGGHKLLSEIGGLGSYCPHIRTGYYSETYPSLGYLDNKTFGIYGTENNTFTSYGMFFWVDTNNGRNFIQGGRTDGNTTAYPIILNFLGGGVGVGKVPDNLSLDVNGRVRGDLFFFNGYNGGNAGYVGRGVNDSNNIQLTAYSGATVSLGSNGVDNRLFVATDGKIGINTTTPVALLHVNGATRTGTLAVESSMDCNGDSSFGTSSNVGNTVMTIYSFMNIRANVSCAGTVTIGSLVFQGGNEINNQNGGVFFQYRGSYYVAIGNPSVLSNKLNVDGYVGASGYNYTSDIRDKEIYEDIQLNVENIAQSPSFKFYWKNRKTDNSLHIGTSAQYWQAILPESVNIGNDEKRTLSLSYGELALVAAIAIAKKVVSHEEQIKLLETHVSELEKENDELRKLIA